MKRRLLKPAQESRRGTALVEMALVLPIFMLVTLGIIEFGRAMMIGQLLTNAAREGARMGIIDGNSNADITDTMETFLYQAANIQSQDLDITITVTPGEGNPDMGDEVANAQARDLVSVHVSVPFDKVSFITGSYLSGKTLSGRCAMRHE